MPHNSFALLFPNFKYIHDVVHFPKQLRDASGHATAAPPSTVMNFPML
jgi:hypothetical protein